jgi:hypothetical protein
MAHNKRNGISVGTDNAVSQNKRDIRKGHSLIMLSRSEASRRPTRQTLRGVYPERSEWAQGDKRGPLSKSGLFFETALSRTPPIYRPFGDLLSSPINNNNLPLAPGLAYIIIQHQGIRCNYYAQSYLSRYNILCSYLFLINLALHPS